VISVYFVLMVMRMDFFFFCFSFPFLPPVSEPSFRLQSAPFCLLCAPSSCHFFEYDTLGLSRVETFFHLQAIM
jgi:hypothetical protein